MKRKAVKNKMRTEDRKKIFNKAAFSHEKETRLESIQKLSTAECAYDLIQIIYQSPYKEMKARAVNKLADIFVFTSENDKSKYVKDSLIFIAAYSDRKQTRIASIEKMELMMEKQPKLSILLRRTAAISDYDDTGIIAVEKLKDSPRDLELLIQRQIPRRQAVLEKTFSLLLDRR